MLREARGLLDDLEESTARGTITRIAFGWDVPLAENRDRNDAQRRTAFGSYGNVVNTPRLRSAVYGADGTGLPVRRLRLGSPLVHQPHPQPRRGRASAPGPGLTRGQMRREAGLIR